MSGYCTPSIFFQAEQFDHSGAVTSSSRTLARQLAVWYSVGMKYIAVLFASAFLATLAFASQPSVVEKYGSIQYTGVDGITRTLTDGGNYREPVLSPDGRTVAFIHQDSDGIEEGDRGLTSLWIADGLTGTIRRLIGPSRNTEPHLNFAFFEKPIFSLDGGFVYVSADAWVTSSAVHQVNIATGKERFVIDGRAIAVIRTGRYRGYLLVRRREYRPAPHFGSYNPVYVVRPDAKEIFLVPGSDKDDGEQSVSRWLDANGWKAW